VTSYDAMGNIKTKYNKLTNTTSKYTFNSRNQLAHYEQLDENNQTIKTLDFTYDGLGRRVSKTEDGVIQKYLYDGDDIIAILDESNNIVATLVYADKVDMPLSITNKNGTYYYHHDYQGSIVALTDSSGTVVESFTYDNHYGSIVNHTKDIETNNPYAYTGREFDTPELYYYRARYYDPTIQRFVSEDPLGFAGGDYNFYSYLGNSPLNGIDPFGLSPSCFTINNGTTWVTEKILNSSYVLTFSANIMMFAVCRWIKRSIEIGHNIYQKTEYCIDCSKQTCNSPIPCTASQRDVSTRGKTQQKPIDQGSKTTFGGCLNDDSRDIMVSSITCICPDPNGGEYIFGSSGPKSITPQNPGTKPYKYRW